MFRRAALVLVLLAACGGHEKPSAGPPKPNDPQRSLTADECTALIDHTVGVAKQDPDPRAPALVKRLTDEKVDVLQHCENELKKKDADCTMAATTVAAMIVCGFFQG